MNNKVLNLSDGQQFHQNLKKRKTTSHVKQNEHTKTLLHMEIQSRAWDRFMHVVEIAR
jgi:hypothetical protein